MGGPKGKGAEKGSAGDWVFIAAPDCSVTVHTRLWDRTLGARIYEGWDRRVGRTGRARVFYPVSFCILYDPSGQLIMERDVCHLDKYAALKHCDVFVESGCPYREHHIEYQGMKACLIEQTRYLA